MTEAVGHLIEGRADDDTTGRFLLALRSKGETVAEVAGAARALRRHMTPIRTERIALLDTCGTGGDGMHTFNISTAAALVTAATGVPVAKHGNRGISSRSGSADVLAALGVNIDADVVCVEACLEELGICFCFAPLLHGAMKHVAPVRKKLGVPTIFNALGPLVNPARAGYQLIGVGRAALRPMLAEALSMLGTERAVVVHGSDGLDEITLAGPTDATEAMADGVRQLQWAPEHFGAETGPLEALQVDGPEQSAEMIRDVLAGRPGPARDIVVINAAAALWTAGCDNDLRRCAQLAAQAIDSGAARDLLANLARLSHDG
jgi:anthranilate phosphoribosyltransferase